MRQSALLLLLIIISFFSIAQKPDTTKSTMIQMINKSIELYNAQNFATITDLFYFTQSRQGAKFSWRLGFSTLRLGVKDYSIFLL